jgi:hypothetical protein
VSAEPHNTDWQCHGWDDHIRGQLEHGASLSFRQRLEWLEEMSELVARFRADAAWRRRNALVEGRPMTVQEDSAAPQIPEAEPDSPADPPGPFTPA